MTALFVYHLQVELIAAADDAIAEDFQEAEEVRGAPANRRLDHQQRFVSTKKKHKSAKVRMEKPTPADKFVIAHNLMVGSGASRLSSARPRPQSPPPPPSPAPTLIEASTSDASTTEPAKKKSRMSLRPAKQFGKVL